MIRDPASASKLGKELFKISQNPQEYAQEILEKLESKAKDIILEQIGTIDKEISFYLVNLMWCLLKNQKN